ncbi:hypothetical protein GCM10010347_33340 [Streptomyces cirratus]|uniref:DUF7848 domain-containing protein n=1 Tax=Streptomyces cirratus TaxID=68187 RepID=A0ABQ3F156_9ACTN|nr:hypothetical protein [Streptomyces cirratus]GHB60619.1 hypothetical protein GCM10010347_33340 [Streptomyces cirratus]
MTPRSVIRFANWTMGPETAPEAPKRVHELQCTTCLAASSANEDFETARDWAFHHVGRNPSHQGYRETVTRFWRMTLTN